MTKLVDFQLKQMATALAASIPPHLGKPTVPPISWRQDGEIVVVVLADGRKFSANIQEINALMFDEGFKGAIRDIQAGSYPQKVNLDKVEIPPLAAAQPTSKPAAKRKKKS